MSTVSSTVPRIVQILLMCTWQTIFHKIFSIGAARSTFDVWLIFLSGFAIYFCHPWYRILLPPVFLFPAFSIFRIFTYIYLNFLSILYLAMPISFPTQKALSCNYQPRSFLFVYFLWGLGRNRWGLPPEERCYQSFTTQCRMPYEAGRHSQALWYSRPSGPSIVERHACSTSCFNSCEHHGAIHTAVITNSIWSKLFQCTLQTANVYLKQIKIGTLLGCTAGTAQPWLL